MCLVARRDDDAFNTGAHTVRFKWGAHVLQQSVGCGSSTHAHTHTLDHHYNDGHIGRVCVGIFRHWRADICSRGMNIRTPARAIQVCLIYSDVECVRLCACACVHVYRLL